MVIELPGASVDDLPPALIVIDGPPAPAVLVTDPEPPEPKSTVPPSLEVTVAFAPFATSTVSLASRPVTEPVALFLNSTVVAELPEPLDGFIVMLPPLPASLEADTPSLLEWVLPGVIVAVWADAVAANATMRMESRRVLI